MSATLMKYHPRAGYTYMPGARLRMPSPRGGYLVRANEAGFRSDREFSREKNPNTFRALLFGDSQTAGDGVSNSGRFSDLLEKALPGLEVDNYAVSGQGPDQQLLLYEEQTEVERDLLVIGLYVENIRRITRRLVKSKDMGGDTVVYRAKPYFAIENGQLAVHNVPVPKEAWTEGNLPPEYGEHVYAHGEVERVVDHLKSALRTNLPFVADLGRAVKSAAMRLKRFEPLPEYETPDNPAWLLLAKILTAFITKNSAPTLVVLIPHYFFLSEQSDPSGYQTRFRELATATGCQIYDPLPELLKAPADERKAMWSDAEGHLSSTGHAMLARLLAPRVQRFMPPRTT